MAWIDVENMGLLATDPMLELGIVVTDRLGRERARFQHVIGDNEAVQRIRADTMDSVVRDMHTKNGLFDEVLETYVTRFAVEVSALAFLEEHFPAGTGRIYMAGASVQFDRSVLQAQMRKLHNWFHYRQHDVSTILNLFRMAGIEPDQTNVHKRNIHRSIPDIEDEISVHAWAMNFLLDQLKGESAA